MKLTIISVILGVKPTEYENFIRIVTENKFSSMGDSPIFQKKSEYNEYN